MIEDVEAPLWQWCAGLLAILVVRFFIEDVSSPTPSFPAVFDLPTLIHYSLFFAGAFLSLALAINLFVRDIKGVTKFLAFGFPIIWISPILDLIYSRGGGYRMTYVFAENAGGFLRAFMSVGAGDTLGGLSPGLRVEVLAIVIGAVLYAWIKTRNPSRAIGAGFLVYLVFAFWMDLPGIIGILSGVRAASATPLFSALVNSFAQSRLAANFIPQNIQVSYLYGTELLFNLGMSVVIYLIDFALLVAWLACWNRTKVAAFASNLRPARIGYYYGMIIIGALAAIRTKTLPFIFGWVDVALFLALMLAYLSLFIFAIGVNDLADERIDAISNGKRPLPTGKLVRADVIDGSIIFLAFAMIGGYISGYWPLFTIIAAAAVYYVYSVPPLRLKRIPLLSSFLLSFATLAALFAGFFFIDANKLVADMPIRVVALVIICLTLALNFKDIKDIEGDRADSIWTIPVLFGEKKGKRIVGAMLGASFLAVPVVLGVRLLMVPSAVAALFGYAFCTSKTYEEWRIFALYFAYATSIGILLWVYPLSA